MKNLNNVCYGSERFAVCGFHRSLARGYSSEARSFLQYFREHHDLQ